MSGKQIKRSKESTFDDLLQSGVSRSRVGSDTKHLDEMLNSIRQIVSDQNSAINQYNCVFKKGSGKLGPTISIYKATHFDLVSENLLDFSEEDIDISLKQGWPTVDDVLETAMSSLENSNILAAESIAEISVLKRDIDAAAREIDRSLAETDVLLQRLTAGG